MNCELRIQFNHGLGDCTYFAHQLPLYKRRGYDITVACPADKRILFEPFQTVRPEYCDPALSEQN